MIAFGRALNRVRFGNWWAQKIPPLAGVATIDVLRRHTTPLTALCAIGLVLACVPCVAAYGHVINDWTDVGEDARAGKPNAMHDVSLPRRIALMLALLAAPFVILGPFADAGIARGILALNYVWPTVYSLPGIRLKERGLLGVVCDAAGSHITPTCFVFAAVALVAAGSVNVAVAGVAVLWATALGIKGILYHQIADRANDERAGVATFAGGIDVRRLSLLLGRWNLFVELPISVVLVALIWPFVPLAAAALCIYIALEWTKTALGFEFAVSSDARLRRPSVPFANEMFYVLWLPLAAMLQLALAMPVLAWMPLLFVVLFRGQAALQLRDARGVVAQLRLRARTAA